MVQFLGATRKFPNHPEREAFTKALGAHMFPWCTFVSLVVNDFGLARYKTVLNGLKLSAQFFRQI
jgi:hypothetical protein